MDREGCVGGQAEVALGWGGRVTPITLKWGARGSRRPVRPSAPGGGGGSCQKMRRWPQAAAAAAFIFKLPSGQRARRGGVPAQRASLILGLSGAPRPLPISPLRGSRVPGGASAPGSAFGPLSMAVASLGGLGVSGAATAAASGQDRGPAAHHARPGPAGNDSEAWALRRRWRLVQLVALQGSESPVAQCLSAPAAIPLPARRRPSPGRGPTLLYRPGWAWPPRWRVPSALRGGPLSQRLGTEPPRARPARPAPALECGASSLLTLLLRPRRRGRHGSRGPRVELPPPAAPRWYAPQRKKTM